MLDRPYFMENKEWYEFDFDKNRFVLTSKAPEKAKESLTEFYRSMKNIYGLSEDRNFKKS